jgi:hypothetical protein
MTFVKERERVIKSWQISLLAGHSLVFVRSLIERNVYASSTVLAAGFLFLYQRVGRRVHETVKRMLDIVSHSTTNVEKC